MYEILRSQLRFVERILNEGVYFKGEGFVLKIQRQSLLEKILRLQIKFFDRS